MDEERCGICGRTMPETLDEAIDAGWYPCFWIDEETLGDGTVCPDCVKTKVDFPRHSEPILKPGVLPFDQETDQ
jgi:hypothetical protein